MTNNEWQLTMWLFVAGCIIFAIFLGLAMRTHEKEKEKKDTEIK